MNRTQALAGHISVVLELLKDHTISTIPIEVEGQLPLFSMSPNFNTWRDEWYCYFCGNEASPSTGDSCPTCGGHTVRSYTENGITVYPNRITGTNTEKL